jgi:F0F1-type ATP synthase membrane subunit b/b'
MELERMRAVQQAQLAREEADRRAETERHMASVKAEETVVKMKAERDVLAEPVREIIAPLKETLGDFATLIQRQAAQHEAAMSHLAELIADTRRLVSAPREVIRGPDGRVAGARIAGLN